MRRHSRLPHGLLSLALLALSATACEAPPTKCGPGTADHDGVCIVLHDDVHCGDGTVLDRESGECAAFVGCGPDTTLNENTGRCDPSSECGPGTFLDLATGECAPEQSCGAGTVLDDASGECLPTLICGAGTHLDEESEECVSDPLCQDGATRDPDTGLCVSDLSCGPGQDLVLGFCVQPGEEVVLEADAVEGFPDVNDPDGGGTPETLTLEAIGQRAVFLGNIDRPADTTGAGNLRQDRDVWRFTGTTGQLLSIEVRDLGLPEPAFVLDGPNGYARRSGRDGGAVASRIVVLPYDGEYRVSVLPSSFLATGIPLGDPGAGYVGVVEELAHPAATAVIPGVTAADATTLTGTLTDLRDGFLDIQAAPGTPFQVTFQTTGADTVPAAVGLTSSGTSLGHVQNLSDGDFLAGVTGATGHATVVLDWQELDQIDASYSVDVFAMPLVDRGDLPTDFHTVTARHDLVVGHDSAAFRFTVNERQIAIAEIGGSGVYNPDVQVVGPAGTHSDTRDDDTLFFLAEPGEYFVFVHNDATSDDSDVSMTLQLRTPHELSAGDDVAPPAVGEDLLYGFGGYPDAWAVVTPTQAGLLELNLEASDGDPDLYVFRMDGSLLRAVHRPQRGFSLHVRADDPRPLLVRIDADTENLLGWRLAARRVPLPATLDVEPNDGRAHAVPLPALPAITRGTLDDDEVDVFRIDLDEPLPPGHALEVLFDNLDGDSGSSSLSDGIYVGVRDANWLPLPSLPMPDNAPGVLGSNIAALVPAFEGTGPFYIELRDGLLTSAHEYVLRVRSVPLTGEVEPNDTAADADAIGTVPFHGFGYRAVDDVADVYRVTLTDDLAADASLRVRAANAENNVKFDLTLERDDGTVLLGQHRVFGELAVPGLAAGDYLIRVSGYNGGEPLYRLDVDIGGRVENEPNDIVIEAESLGALGAAPIEITGYAADTDDDLFSFTAPDLSTAESLVVTVVNIDDGSRNEVELYYASSLANGGAFAHDRDVASTLVAQRAAAGDMVVRVRGASATPDRYRLRIERGGPAELEPNDTAALATAITAAPVRVLGTTSGGETDVWMLPADAVPAGATVHARLENESDGSSIHFSLRSGSFESERAEGTGFRVNLQTSLAGPWFFVVEGTGDPSLASDVYSIDLEVTP